jgi:hypothetical protein
MRTGMKLLIPQNHKFLCCFWLLWMSSFGFSQSQVTNDAEACDVILKLAGAKYQVVFNYDYNELKEIPCLNELPDTFTAFRELLAEYSGLLMEPYASNIWIVKKNYTHHFKFLDIKNNPTVGVTSAKYNQKSNRFGNLFIQVKKYPETIVFHYQNYDNQLVEIDESSPKVIAVNMIQYMLSEVILNDLYINGVFLTNDKHIKVKPRYTPILAGQVQQNAFISVLNLPQISTTAESVAELNIKGGVNDQNLVLWNGIKIFQNAHFFGHLSAFNENLIETITVIDNATPAQYGNSLSGTVKLDYDANYTDKSSYGVGLNILSGQAFLRQKLANDFELSFAMQRSFTDVFQTTTFDSYRQKVYQDTELELTENPIFSENIQREDRFYFQDAQVQLKKRINKKLHLTVQGLWFENVLDYAETFNSLNFKNSTVNNVNTALGFNAHYQWNDSNSLAFMYNVSKHKSEGNSNTFSGNLNTFQFNSVDDYFLQLLWSNKQSKHKFSGGIDFEGTQITNQFTNEVTTASLNLVQIGNIYAAFGDYSFHSDRWSLYTGLRNVYYQRDEQWRLEPRFTASYKLNETFEMSLRGEIKSQNLKQVIDLDQNFLGIEKRRWLLTGEDELPLQSSQQIETLIKFDKNKFGGFASLFLREIKGISSDDQRFQNENQFNNFQDGSAQILGAMLHLFYKDNIVNTWLSYSFLNEEIRTPNQNFTGPTNLHYHITWGNSLRYQQWNFAFSCVYHDGLPFTSINEETPINTDVTNNINTINYNEPNSEKLVDYFRMDASVQYELQTKSNHLFKFSLGIINLTDSNNVLRRNFRLNRVDDNQIQEIETAGLGFTPNIGVLYIF